MRIFTKNEQIYKGKTNIVINTVIVTAGTFEP